MWRRNVYNVTILHPVATRYVTATGMTMAAVNLGLSTLVWRDGQRNGENKWRESSQHVEAGNHGFHSYVT